MEETADILANLMDIDWDSRQVVEEDGRSYIEDIDEWVHGSAENTAEELKKLVKAGTSKDYLPETLFYTGSTERVITFTSEQEIAWPSNKYFILYEVVASAEQVEFQNDVIELVVKKVKGKDCSPQPFLYFESFLLANPAGFQVEEQPDKTYVITIQREALNRSNKIGDQFLLRIPPRCSLRLIKAERQIPIDSNPSLLNVIEEKSAEHGSRRTGLRRRNGMSKNPVTTIFGTQMKFLTLTFRSP